MNLNYFGVRTQAQFQAMGERRRYLGARVAYSLLDVGSDPSPEDIRTFEDVCFTLRLSNGTFRTSFRNRFADLNEQVQELLPRHFDTSQPLMIQDRAVSHALTSAEWAKAVLPAFPHAHFEASDMVLSLLVLSLRDGSSYVAEPDGTVLQASRGRFVFSMFHRESLRYPLHRLLAAREQRKFRDLPIPENWYETDGGDGFRVRRFSFIHPEANQLAAAEPRFTVTRRSVFDVTEDKCHVLRTMNILNRDYFPDAQLQQGASAAFRSLHPGGLWVVGRTTEHDFRNHASILKRQQDGFTSVERIGDGSELETLFLNWRPGSP
jgi:hypothetical protein